MDIVFPTSFVVKTVHSPLNSLGTLVRNYFIHSGLSLTLYYILGPVHLSFMLKPCFFFYCSFVVSFEIIKCKSSSFILVQDFFDYLGSLRFHVNFRGIFFYFCQNKKNLRILIGSALNLLITLGSIDILTVLKSANL